MKVLDMPEKCALALDVIAGLTFTMVAELKMNGKEKDFLMRWCKPEIMNHFVKKAELNDASIGIKKCMSCDKDHVIWVIDEKLPNGSTDKRQYDNSKEAAEDIQRMPL